MVCVCVFMCVETGIILSVPACIGILTIRYFLLYLITCIKIKDFQLITGKELIYLKANFDDTFQSNNKASHQYYKEYLCVNRFVSFYILAASLNRQRLWRLIASGYQLLMCTCLRAIVRFVGIIHHHTLSTTVLHNRFSSSLLHRRKLLFGRAAELHCRRQHLANYFRY